MVVVVDIVLEMVELDIFVAAVVIDFVAVLTVEKCPAKMAAVEPFFAVFLK